MSVRILIAEDDADLRDLLQDDLEDAGYETVVAIDGRAAIAHMAIPVGPGRHAVELRLVRPFLVAAADTTTVAAWVALALGLPAAWVRARLRRADQPEGRNPPAIRT